MRRSSRIFTNTATSAGAAEAVVGTVYPPVGGDGPVPSALIISGDLVHTGGTNAASTSIRIRKGSLTGTQIGPTVAGGSAAQAVNVRLFGKDTSPSGGPYVITTASPSQSAAGTVDGYVTVDA